MKKLHLFFVILLFNSSILFSQVSINTDGSAPNNSAMLDVKSTSKGFLPPRMTHAELNAIPTPADGLIVYCTDCGLNGTGTLSMFTAGAWYSLSANCINPLTPATGTHIAAITQIVWNWNAVTGATGYKWNMANDYSTATDMGTATAKTETGLTCGTAYTRYVWAYSGCGNSISLALSQTASACAGAPTVSTTAVTEIAQTTATSGGNVTADGGAAVTARGVCWSSTSIPTITSSKTSDAGTTGIFTSSITGLTAGTTYFVRAYATNNAGTSYGREVSFTALANLPTVSTTPATSIAATTAASGGNVTTDGGAAVTARGICWGMTANPTIAGSKTTDAGTTGIFTSSITGLTAGTTYFVRAYATNSVGTAYGNEVNFTTTNTYTVTLSSNPLAGGTTSGSGVFNSGASVTVNAVANAGYTFTNWTESGTAVSTTASYTFNISGNRTLVANYTTTPGAVTVTDIDGNVYNTVTIGTQVWMAENLKTTKYNDGTSIPLVSDNTAWTNLTAPGYCWYNNDATTYKTTYGALYNWYTVNTGKLAPTGWHVATDAEWTTLTTYLGGESVAGDKLKEAGTTHWISHNTGATNTTGFTALPGGTRTHNGSYGSIGSSGMWWSSTESNTYFAFVRTMVYGYSRIYTEEYGKVCGTSVRCVKDDNVSSVVIPTVSTTAVSAIAQTTATSGGNVTDDGGAAVTARGVCWSSTSIPNITSSKTTDAGTTGIFTSSITGLTAGTTYFVRAYATNSVGTAYGNEVNFTTTPGAVTVTDIDGNVYNTVTIGTQVWMAENLKTTKYRNGDAIPNVTDNTFWTALTSGAYCNYNNDAANAVIYGKLYNWYAATDTRNIAPTGWHVPSDAEWTTLTTYLGGESVAGGKMKETGTAHWQSASTGVSNESGFTALPGGGRNFNGLFPPSNDLYYRGNWWSTTQYNTPPAAWFRMIDNTNNQVVRGFYNGANGFSIRLVKD